MYKNIPNYLFIPIILAKIVSNTKTKKKNQKSKKNRLFHRLVVTTGISKIWLE